MITTIFGLIVFGAGVASLWYFRPRDGKVHPLAERMLLDSAIPVAIVSLLAVGLAMIVAGFGIS